MNPSYQTPAAFKMGMEQRLRNEALRTNTATRSRPSSHAPVRNRDLHGSLLCTQPQTLYGQFVFLDGGLPLGLGLSNASVLVMPAPSASSHSRTWNAPTGGSSSGGFELATTGTTDKAYGFVVGFDV